MTDRDTAHDHAVLEAQRQRSNVYAFRTIKWGNPKSAMNGRQWVPRPKRRPGNRLVAMGIAVLLGVLAAALWLG